MKIALLQSFFALILSTVSVCSNAQVLCGTVGEGGTVTLTAPPGCIFISVEFASYGTPNGSCGSFTIGVCHAANSASICSAIIVGNNSASVSATNGVFGDPCGGTPKRLYIQARYSSTLPVNLISFSAKKIDPTTVRLDWLSENEINTSHFVIERSKDGSLFEAAGSVPATGVGAHNYNFTNIISGTEPVYYYRLKMVDVGGKFEYSNIVRINNNLADTKLSVFPNPADRVITITSGHREDALITNATGELIEKIALVSGSRTVNIASWKPGVYFIKTEKGILRFIKK